MTKEPLHFKLRIPEELLNKVRERTATSNRTMTGEILHMLERFPEIEKKLLEREEMEIHLKEAEEEIYRLRKNEEKYKVAETNAEVMTKIEKLENDMASWKNALLQFGMVNGLEPLVSPKEHPAPAKKTKPKK